MLSSIQQGFADDGWYFCINHSAGWGDQLTIWFFGGTRRLRDSITWGGTSINETIDFNSGEYLAGRGIGAVHELTLIGVARASWLREGKRWMEVNVGTGAKYLTYRYHTVYGVGEKLVHAAGKIPFLRVINWSARRNWKPWVTFKLPILYPERVLQTGQGAGTCITAACSAFFRGWFKWR